MAEYYKRRIFAFEPQPSVVRSPVTQSFVKGNLEMQLQDKSDGQEGSVSQTRRKGELFVCGAADRSSRR